MHDSFILLSYQKLDVGKKSTSPDFLMDGINSFCGDIQALISHCRCFFSWNFHIFVADKS